MRRILSIVAVFALAACHRASRSAPPLEQVAITPASTCNGSALDPKPVGGVALPGLEETAHRPIVVYEDMNAWSGSPEGLPALTIYEDGLAIRSTEDGITTGKIDSSVAVAACASQSLAGLAPRIDVSGATDQPEVTVSARVGEVWRSVTVVGLLPDDQIHAPVAETPKAFLDLRHTLQKLPLRDAQPFTRTDYKVTVHDDSVPSSLATPWPKDVPPPPSGLIPDTRWVGNPRWYVLKGDAGATLQTFARAQHAGAVLTPAGNRVSLMVQVTIPDQSYIERLERCFPWEPTPFHRCDR